MSIEHTNQERRNPYDKKLRQWEEEVIQIENFIGELPDANIIKATCSLLYQLINHSSDIDLVAEKQEKLEKIKAGVQKMKDTLSYAILDDPSNNDFDSYIERLVKLQIKIDLLSDQLSEKDLKKYMRYMLNNES
ncbi:hypothetical protein VB715_00560 [Crocosphaera sp. UHCC 0190]|uniref:hypothetical protein n=1 Tax=Crocosphaera sp. UHCC 0190 TaxID=3110246 RepID=UPI002B202252|nr:hypothetical protein [Crocosphaera sp. UHCC 0190]MEA5508246.1 hypothetical protein [Crocosphaera sp. UHCC 0190]